MEERQGACQIGVVGGGEATAKALRSLSAGRVSLAGVACERGELLGLVSPTLRVRSYRELFERPDVKAVYLATPVDSHVDLAFEALACGKHVLVEKPLARTPAEAYRLADGDCGLVIAIALKKRYADAVRLAKGRIDDAAPIRATYHWSIHHPRTAWRYSRASGGGILLDLGSHAIDILEFLLGPIESVSATLPLTQGDEAEGSAEIDLSFSHGHSARVALDWSEGLYRQELKLVSERGEVRIERPLNGDDLLWHDSALTKCARDSEYLGLFNGFVDAIDGKASDVPLLRDGLRNLSLLDACFRSAATGGDQVKL